MTRSLEVLSQILLLCRNRPDLSQLAQTRLNEITGRLGQNGGGVQPAYRYQAEKALAECNARRKKDGRGIVKMQSVNLRDVCKILSKRLGIAFDGGKPPKKRDDVMKWFDEHWTEVQDPFLRILDSTNPCAFK